MRRACGPARWSPRSATPSPSGRASPSTRTPSSATPTATPATSRDRAGSCPTARPPPDAPRRRTGVAMAYSLPEDVDQRPVTIAGAGTLGRRIATVFAAGGSDVRVFDTSAEQLEAGRAHVEQHVADVQQTLDLRPERTGRVEVADDLPGAVDGAWLVIESVTERVDVKTDVFGELDRVAAPDAVLA